MIDTKALRSRILDLAMQGKLTEQLESDGTAEELYQQIQEEMTKKQEDIYKGVKDKVDEAVGSVASTKGLSLVVDKRAVLYGGQDITEQVSKKLSESQSK